MSETAGLEKTTETAETAVIGAKERESGWHPVNIGHLVMGLAFLCMVGAWALVQGDVVTGDNIRWLLPVPWLVAGAIGLGAAAISSARRHGIRR